MGGRSKSRQGAILCVVSVGEYSKIRGWGSSVDKGEFQNFKAAGQWSQECAHST